MRIPSLHISLAAVLTVHLHSSKRMPAWTDRVMYATHSDSPDTPQASNITNVLYTAIPSYTTSDHVCRLNSCPCTLLSLYLYRNRLFRCYSFLHQRKETPDRIVHPIPKLMKEAEEKYIAKLRRQSRSLDQAVAEYKRRYKIDPPKDFDLWWQ